MNNIELFEKQKYVELKKVLSSDMITLISTYARLDEANDFSLEDGPTPQIHNSHSQYADTLMESLLLCLLPTMEENTGLKLYPAYSYYRVYKPGADLVKHIDRPACEISTTITLEYDYKGADYEWPIFVGNSRCAMTPGDLVIYRGCEIDHWREVFTAPEGSFHIQVFCHYVDANGPNSEWKFDKRPFIGFDKEGKFNKALSKFYFPNKPYLKFTG